MLEDYTLSGSVNVEKTGNAVAITCGICGKINASHIKNCVGCGIDLTIQDRGFRVLANSGNLGELKVGEIHKRLESGGLKDAKVSEDFEEWVSLSQHVTLNGYLEQVTVAMNKITAPLPPTIPCPECGEINFSWKSHCTACTKYLHQQQEALYGIADFIFRRDDIHTSGKHEMSTSEVLISWRDCIIDADTLVFCTKGSLKGRKYRIRTWPPLVRLLDEGAKQLLLTECINCNQMISKRAKSCPSCGKEVPETKECNVCNQFIIASSKACPNCGDPQPFVIRIFPEFILGYDYKIDNKPTKLSSYEQFKQLVENGKIGMDTMVYRSLEEKYDYVKILEFEDTTLIEVINNIKSIVKSVSSLLTKCNSCAHTVSKRSDCCPECGEVPKEKCTICTILIPTNSRVCPNCGDPEPFNDSGQIPIKHAIPEEVVTEEIESISKPSQRNPPPSVGEAKVVVAEPDNSSKGDITPEPDPSHIGNTRTIVGEEPRTLRWYGSWLWMGIIFQTLSYAIAKEMSLSRSRSAHEYASKSATETVAIVILGFCIGAALGYAIWKNIDDKRIRIGAYVVTSGVGFFLYCLMLDAV